MRAISANDNNKRAHQPAHMTDWNNSDWSFLRWIRENSDCSCLAGSDFIFREKNPIFPGTVTGSNVKLIFSDHTNSREQVVSGGWRRAGGIRGELLSTQSCSWTRQMNQALGLWKKKMIPFTFLVQPEPGESAAASGLPRVQKTPRLSACRRAEQGCVRTTLSIRRLKCWSPPLFVGFVNTKKTWLSLFRKCHFIQENILALSNVQALFWSPAGHFEVLHLQTHQMKYFMHPWDIQYFTYQSDKEAMEIVCKEDAPF